MSWIHGAVHRTRVLVMGERYAREQAEELRFHLELERQQHADDGDARARQKLGNLSGWRETLREVSGFRFPDRFRQDLSYALRGLRRSPSFTITVILTLALGVGANAAMFSFLDRVFFRAPPGVVDPDGVRRIYRFERDPFGGLAATRSMQRFTYVDFTTVRDAMQRGAAVAADIPSTWGTGRKEGDPETGFVSENYFDLLGVRAAYGRLFSPEEMRIDVDSRVAVITHRLWQRRFGGDSSVLGKTIDIYGKSYSIVGVTQKGFDGIDIDIMELMLPLHAFPVPPRNGREWYQDAQNWSPLRGIMRVHAGAGELPLLAAATGAFRAIQPPRRVVDSTMKLIGGPLIASLGPAENVKEISLAARIAGVTIIVLLIACANVASLLLVRASRRRREIAVRLALGVTRGRLWSQLFTESLTLAAIGCTFALLVAHWGGTALRKLLLPETAWAGPPVDLRVVLFTASIAVVVGLIAGLAPAFQATRADVHDALKSGARDSGSRRSPLRSTLLAAQGAMAVILLIGAGLFVRTLGNIRTLPLGFDTQRMIYAGVPWAPDSLSANVTTALTEAASRMATVPGVRGATIAGDMPMAGGRTGYVTVPERDSTARGMFVNYVAANFFSVTGMPFVAGRAFTPDEAQSQAAVIVVNQSFARYFWPHENAIGKCVIVGRPPAPCSLVVGVTHDTRSFQIIEARSMLQFFVPLRPNQTYYRPNYLIVNAEPANTAEIGKRMTEELRTLLPGVTSRVRRTAESLEPQYRPWEMGAKIFTAFGILAVIVAAIGVYSVIAYSVSERKREVGVRVALGAQARDVLDLVVGEGMKLVAIGVAVGIGVAIALGKFVESQMFGVSTRDPFVMIGAASVLGAVALIACLIPALRAARADPMDALRAE